MAVKQWSVGDVLSAADLNSWTVPITGVKSANQTIISQTTLVNDADMRVAVAANATYEFMSYIRFSSGTGQDFKVSMSAPAGADARYMALRRDLTDTFGGAGDFTAADTIPCIGKTVGVINTCLLIGTLFTTTTAGNLITQWAQNTSGAFNTTLYQYSRLTARRIG